METTRATASKSRGLVILLMAVLLAGLPLAVWLDLRNRGRAPHALDQFETDALRLLRAGFRAEADRGIRVGCSATTCALSRR